MKEGLNRTQLKLIAIAAMVCDHTAWGFVKFFSPLGQIMHIIGRLTIPTMCFFVAEGFRHTSNRKAYLGRMTLFWVLSVIPFYLFFHEHYAYRQNIIFDLMLGLMMLLVLESARFVRWQKVALVALLFVVSMIIGGWVIVPSLFILAFYYGRDFQTQAKLVCGITVTLVAFLVVATSLNQRWHFSSYEGVWYGQLYFLGFMLPLLLLRRYNGQKGRDIGRYFFYVFYPAHFLVLWGVKELLAVCSLYQLYLAIHIVSLLVCLGILILVLFARPSRGQSGALLLVFARCTYIFGFVLEITSKDVSGCYTGTLVQYFGECVLMIGFTIFISEMCCREVPAFVYGLECVIGIFVMWMLFTTRENHIYYRMMDMETSGPFPRFLLDRGPGFTFFVIYSAAVCAWCIAVCLIGLRNCKGTERKRLLCMIAAILCPWIPNFIRDMGLTGGYEIPGIGIAGAIVLVGLVLTRLGYFDSIALAGENALNHGKEGIMVINTHRMITYYNKRMEQMFGKLSLKEDAYHNPQLADIFEGRLRTLERDGRMYEMRVESLLESGYIQGQMLWMLDITEHHSMLMQVNELASKDALTGVYNAGYFRKMVEEHLSAQGNGALVMLDISHFMTVNDRFGHLVGDELLARFGVFLQELGEHVAACRIGGSEFCLFYKGKVDVKELGIFAERLREGFAERIADEKYAGMVSVSIGITRTLDAVGRDFEKLYSSADKALYVAKNRSTNGYYIL